MALVAELWSDSPICSYLLTCLPETTLYLEDLCHTADGIVRGYYWIEGADFAEFNAFVADDPTITNPKLLTEIKERRLCRVDLTEATQNTFSDWGALDITVISAQATQRGWQVVFRFPDRETISEFRAKERAIGNEIDIQRLYREEADGAAGATLTPAQRDALSTAHGAGYFTVPRRASQKAVAAKMDITAQSLSERLRRGTAALIEATIEDGRR